MNSLVAVVVAVAEQSWGQQLCSWFRCKHMAATSVLAAAFTRSSCWHLSVSTLHMLQHDTPTLGLRAVLDVCCCTVVPLLPEGVAAGEVLLF
jgi:hypothetical protein